MPGDPILSLNPTGAYWDETVFLATRNDPETKGSASCPQQTGMAEMQFFLDLIWTQSCRRYLASVGKLEAEV